MSLDRARNRFAAKRFEAQPVDTQHNFWDYHNARVAVRLGASLVIRGVAVCENDRMRGLSLRIRLDSGTNPGNAEIVIVEREWQGRIVADDTYGTDYLFDPAGEPIASEVQLPGT
ncbi:MAG: hypothetical protein J5I93_29350 [Pirellulaceae bacterium]|nr:hypothetical protein [Pirellulaceae bacterium]